MEKLEDPIYKTVVHMENQFDCDRAKEICIKYKLPVWEDECAFDYVDHKETHLFYRDTDVEGEEWSFYVDIIDDSQLAESDVVSIEEFEQMAQELNVEYNSVDDILIKMKELTRTLNQIP